MTIEQLNELLEGTLHESGLDAMTSVQQTILARVKQGGDAIFCGEPEEATTGIAFSAIVKAPRAFEGSPRVLILSPTIDSVHALHKQLTIWTRRTEIAVELAHDKGNMILERNNIFDGADIIVGNPKRIMELYNQNGIHVGQLTLFVVDQADVITKDPVMAQRIHRLAESLPKCQRFILTSKMTPRVEKLAEELCIHPKMFAFDATNN